MGEESDPWASDRLESVERMEYPDHTRLGVVARQCHILGLRLEEQIMHEAFPSSSPNNRRILFAAGAGSLALIVLGLVSCGPTAEQRYERRLADTGKPAMHGIQSQRVKDLMHKFTFDPLSESEQGVAEEQRRADQLAEVAFSMSETSKSLMTTAKDLQMSDADRATFLSLAEKFRGQADAVGQAAKAKNFTEARRAIDRMQSTCNACHTLFRS